MLTFSVLSATYVAVTSYSCVLSYVAVDWAISVYYQRHSFISLNFAGLFSIETRFSTQLSMTSHSKNEAVNVATFNLFTGHFVEFKQCFCSFYWQFGHKYDQACI